MDCNLSRRWVGLICEGESLIGRKDGSCVDTIVCADAVLKPDSLKGHMLKVAEQTLRTIETNLFSVTGVDPSIFRTRLL